MCMCTASEFALSSGSIELKKKYRCAYAYESQRQCSYLKKLSHHRHIQSKVSKQDALPKDVYDAHSARVHISIRSKKCVSVLGLWVGAVAVRIQNLCCIQHLLLLCFFWRPLLPSRKIVIPHSRLAPCSHVHSHTARRLDALHCSPLDTNDNDLIVDIISLSLHRIVHAFIVERQGFSFKP